MEKTLKFRLFGIKYRIGKWIDRRFGRFHETKFSFSDTWKMALSFIILYVIGSRLIKQYATATHVKVVTGSYMVVNFLLMEFLPIILIGLLFGVMALYRHGHHDFFTNAKNEVVKWCKAFAKDFWHHKGLIILSAILLMVLEIIMNKLITHIFIGGAMAPNKNNLKILKLMRQSAWMLFATDIIAPLTEELVFRFWVPKMITHMLSSAWGGRARRFTYYAGIVLSAMFFAGLHIQSNEPFVMGFTYIAMAFFLQYIKEKSQSLTAPAMVHAMNNSIITGMSLI